MRGNEENGIIRKRMERKCPRNVRKYLTEYREI